MKLNRTRPRVAQALVEFALVMPLVILTSFGILQLALYAHARDVVISSVQEGARLAAEDGRTLDDGQARTRALVTAGLGTSVEPVSIVGSVDDEIVHLRLVAALHPVLPLPTRDGLPLDAEAWVARERFRPGGGQ